jgi:hypothetical protein
MLLGAERDLSVETLVQNLDLVLRVLPEEALAGQQAYEQAQESNSVSRSHSNRHISSNTTAAMNLTDMASSLTLESMHHDMAVAIQASSEPDAEAGRALHNDEVSLYRAPSIDSFHAIARVIFV